MFHTKKIEGSTPTFSPPRHYSEPPQGLRPPVEIVFGLAKNQCAHIFSVPWHMQEVPIIMIYIYVDSVL